MSGERKKDIYALAAQFREQLARREASALEDLRAAYELAWEAIKRELEKTQKKLSEENASAAAVLQNNRLNSLAEQIKSEMMKLAEFAAGRTEIEQRAAVKNGIRQAEDLIAAAKNKPQATINFAKLSTKDFEHLVGVTRSGTPLNQYFADLAGKWNSKATDAVRQAMLEGAVLGQNTTRVASRARQLLDANAHNKQQDPEIIRSLRLTVRTEMHRAARETTREVYRENGIREWQWRSARTPRTCVICWAMDGKVFPVSEPMATHVACRCVKLPVIRKSDVAERETGAEAFAKLEKGYQKQILGEERFKLYESGEIKRLEDFVGHGVDEKWGAFRYRRSLQQLGVLRNGGDIEPSDKPDKPDSQSNKKPVVIPAYVRQAKPTGKPVSEAFRVEIADERVEKAIELIDSVHGDGELPNLPIRKLNKSRAVEGRVGGYSHKEGKPRELLLNMQNAHLDEALIHEVGHFLDHQVMDASGKFASARGRTLSQLRKLLDETNSVQLLKAVSQADIIEYIDESGATEIPVNKKFVNYLLARKELFARAYTQFIAIQSGNEELLEYLDKLKQSGDNYYPEFWRDEEFEPIYNFFFDLFAKRQWLKPNGN